VHVLNIMYCFIFQIKSKLKKGRCIRKKFIYVVNIYQTAYRVWQGFKLTKWDYFESLLTTFERSVVFETAGRISKIFLEPKTPWDNLTKPFNGCSNLRNSLKRGSNSGSPLVNFINVFRTHFSYESLFSA